MIKIDSNIPVPKRSRAGTFLETCRLMEVGQSAFFAGRVLGGASSRLFQLRPRRFTGRTVTEDGVKGVRVWRVE